MRRVRVTIFFREKAISIAYSENVSVALIIQRAMRMRLIVICDLSGSTVIPTLSHTQHGFTGGKSCWA